MSEVDPPADTPLLNWSDLSVSGLLPTGMATLVLADVEGSTRRLLCQLCDVLARHDEATIRVVLPPPITDFSLYRERIHHLDLRP